MLKCTSTNKRLCLVAVSYSGTTITDTTDNVSIGATPDPAERSFQGPTKRNPNPPNCTS